MIAQYPPHVPRRARQPHRDQLLPGLGPQRDERPQAGDVDEGQPADVYHEVPEAGAEQFVDTGGELRSGGDVELTVEGDDERVRGTGGEPVRAHRYRESTGHFLPHAV